MDSSLLTAALIGYEIQLQKIRSAIAEIHSQLRPATVGSDAAGATALKPKRQMSTAARKRIAAAQKKRWAAFHTQSETPATKNATPKRKMSPERRAALVANLAKARQARAANRAAA
jgi:hypothetical protein